MEEWRGRGVGEWRGRGVGVAEWRVGVEGWGCGQSRQMMGTVAQGCGAATRRDTGITNDRSLEEVEVAWAGWGLAGGRSDEGATSLHSSWCVQAWTDSPQLGDPGLQQSGQSYTVLSSLGNGCRQHALFLLLQTHFFLSSCIGL